MLQATNQKHAGPQGMGMPGDLSIPTAKGHEPEAVIRARNIMAGKLHLGAGLSLDEADLRAVDAEWPAAMFWPEETIEDFSEPDTVKLLAVRLEMSAEDEDAALNPSPSPRRSQVLALIYESAIKEAVETLMGLSPERGNHEYRNCRMRVRMCAAVREELAELLAEWDKLNLGGRDVD